MGIGLFPVYDPPVIGAEFNSDGKLLAAQLYALDALCVELGVPKMSAFTDNREPPAGFEIDPDGDLDELEEMLGEWEEWFAPDQALPILQALIQALSSQGEIAAKVHDAEWLVQDLREIEAGLQAAVAADAKFRFEIF